MKSPENYYANFGDWDIADFVKERILKDPSEMERFQAVIRAIPEGIITVLDVGCGPGVFLSQLKKQRGIKGIGVEITTSKIRYAKDHLAVSALKGDVGSLSFQDKSFDVVTALEVLEHLPYGTYEQALVEISRVAKHSIIVTVPYREHRTLIACPYCGIHFNPNYHMRSFDEDGLVALFPNFSLVTCEKMGHYYSQPDLVRDFIACFTSQPYPEFAFCPACGFHKSAKEAKGRVSFLKLIFSTGLRAAFVFARRVQRSRWMMAVFERDELE